MSKELKYIIGAILLFIIIGLIGTDEYEFEKRQESVTIENNENN
jgi:hypothetical protein